MNQITIEVNNIVYSCFNIETFNSFSQLKQKHNYYLENKKNCCASYNSDTNTYIIFEYE